MKRIITILLITISTISFGQEVKKMKENKNYGKATFYVLKSDMKTKHGKYSIKGYTGRALIVEGNYSNGKKDGIWTERYYRKGRNLKSQGKYENDIQVGNWTFYDFKGEPVQEYDFDNNKLITSKECSTDKEYDVIIEDKPVKSKLDCPPSYIGGYSFLIYELNQKIMTSFDFPVNKKGRTEIKINSNISFLLKKDGTIENIQYSEPLENEKLKDFIKSQINEKRGKWLVAELNGSKLDSKMNIPIRINIMY